MEKRPQTNIRFIHLRNNNIDGSISPNGGMTIAYTRNEKGLVVGWASAKCHIRDNFNKVKGRMKAAGRLLSAHYYNDCPELNEKTFIEKCNEQYQVMMKGI